MACSLVLSLLVSASNLRLAAAGDVDIVVAGVRYVVAFVVAFVAVGAIGRVLRDYVASVDARRADEEPPAAEPHADGGVRLAEE